MYACVSSDVCLVHLNKRRRVPRNASTLLRHSSLTTLPQPFPSFSLSPASVSSSACRLRPYVERAGPRRTYQPVALISIEYDVALLLREWNASPSRRVAPWRRDLETTRPVLVSRADTNSLTALTIRIPRGRRCRRRRSSPAAVVVFVDNWRQRTDQPNCRFFDYYIICALLVRTRRCVAPGEENGLSMHNV